MRARVRSQWDSGHLCIAASQKNNCRILRFTPLNHLRKRASGCENMRGRPGRRRWGPLIPARWREGKPERLRELRGLLGRAGGRRVSVAGVARLGRGGVSQQRRGPQGAAGESQSSWGDAGTDVGPAAGEFAGRPPDPGYVPYWSAPCLWGSQPNWSLWAPPVNRFSPGSQSAKRQRARTTGRVPGGNRISVGPIRWPWLGCIGSAWRSDWKSVWKKPGASITVRGFTTF